MEKEILLYGDINSYSAAGFIASLNAAKEDDIIVRVATDGGDPEYGFGMVAKFAEHAKGKSVKVDGKAYSMGTFFCLYADAVEALNVSQFLVHRAAYPAWVEKDETIFTEAMKDNLAKVNASLRAAFEAKIDVEAFQKIKKVTVDEIFSMDTRKDVFLTAKEAEKVGLINKVININPKKKAEIESRFKIAAKYSSKQAQLEIEIEPIINTTMTLEELKASHPNVFAQAVSEGITQGIAQERDRAASWLPYMAADTEVVSKAIKDGSVLSASVREELNVKMFTANSLKVIGAANATTVVTQEINMGANATDAEKAAKEKNLLDFRNAVRAQLNVPLLK